MYQNLALGTLLSVNLALSACAGDETISGYAPDGMVWVLAEIDGNVFPARATISFPSRGKIRGEAPCNGYGGTQASPYPWFRAEDILSTQRACADLASEQVFFTALQQVSLAEVQEDTLILSDPNGPVMVFRPQP